jgi:hypothetical protein
MNIGERRRTIYIEPIEEPATAPIIEPSPSIHPEPSKPVPEIEPEPAR